MDTRTRREALRAAAKVALSLAAAGAIACGATTQDTGEAPSAIETRKPKDSGPADVDVARCETDLDALKAELAPDAEFDIPPIMYTRTPEVLACCQSLLERSSDWSDGAPPETKHRWNCCATINNSVQDFFSGPMACTPWGPPMPPSMPAALLLEVA